MGKQLKSALLSLRDLLATAWWVILIAGIGFFVAFNYVKPAPPDHIIISTGAEGGAYYRFAGRYAAVLARQGIALEVRPSNGSLENLARLEKGEADVAFIQGGIVTPREDAYSFEESPAEALSSVFYEPVWVFYRGDKKIDRLSQLAGKRVAIGQEGSGVRQLAQQLLEASGVTATDQHVGLGGSAAVKALQAGQLDAVFIVAAVEAQIVQDMLHAPGVRVMNFSQADAYTRRFPFLSRLILPQGASDLAQNLPPEDTALLAATASLAVRPDLHPAIQSLLLQAAQEVHSKNGFFQKSGEFPAYRDQSLPLSATAERVLKNGPSFLQRYLPFWLAVMVDRMIVLLVPIFALLLPLIKVAPALYSWRIRSRIFRIYGELKFLENEIKKTQNRSELEALLQHLDQIEEEANGLHVPVSFADLTYTLREHVNLVRQTLLRAKESLQP